MSWLAFGNGIIKILLTITIKISNFLGDGPRNCIGLRFGMMQARIGLVTLLNNFEFSLGSNMSTTLSFDPKLVILSPPSGVYLKVKPVKAQN